MARKYQSLEDILDSDDELGLLKIKERPRTLTTQGRAEAGFLEINDFIDKNSRLPTEFRDESEKKLAWRLKAIKENPERFNIPADFDVFGLLTADHAEDEAHPEQTLSPESIAEDPGTYEAPPKEVFSLDDILESDDLGLLTGGEESIFEAKHVSFEKDDRDTPDFIAQQTPCDDFWRFDSLFKGLTASLAEGKAKSVRFQMASQIDKGDFFIVRGVTCLVDQVGEDNWVDGKNNPRLRVIFDNGTEANLLKLSLARALYKDDHGRRILLDADTAVTDRMTGITHLDKRTGVIYILKPRTPIPALRDYGELYKVGYSEGTTEDRISNAEKEATYLGSAVEIATEFECYNLNPQRFESLVHGFLAERRLNLSFVGDSGKTHHPKEWFTVPLKDLIEVIQRVVDGTIVEYKIDATTGRIVKKNKNS